MSKSYFSQSYVIMLKQLRSHKFLWVVLSILRMSLLMTPTTLSLNKLTSSFSSFIASDYNICWYHWVDIVIKNNYHDHPHMIKDFKKLVGLTPEDFNKTNDSIYQRY